MTPLDSELAVWLRARVAQALGVGPEAVDPTLPLWEQGVDSIAALAITRDLGARLGRELPATFFFEYPNLVAALAADAGAGAAGRAPAPLRDASDPVAIVGAACRVPGAPDVESFWRLLDEGTPQFREVPPGRWDEEVLVDLTASERALVRTGAFLDDVDSFDPAFFRITPREAAEMDPQQRLVLELCWEALDDAGLLAGGAAPPSTGVFVGAIFSEQAERSTCGTADGFGPHTATGTHRSIIANRVSYAFGLRGPSFVVDSACSSGLLAAHIAARALRDGECDVALAGAVNLDLRAENALATSRFGALSPSGACRPFDARADGYVRGEGAAILVLKRLSRALEDGDRVLGLLRGSATNNDGATNGITAPSVDAQADVIARAWADAGLAPSHADAIEAHGTGTQLGDPIETRALQRVFGPDRHAPLPVGSAKAVVGHLEGAAGAIGLLKAVHVAREGRTTPNRHLDTLNPHIDAPQLGFPVEATAIGAADRPCRVGVSSFGFGGANAHAVVEAWPPTLGSARVAPTEVKATGGAVLVFPGQGAQWAGMSRTLLDDPVFGDALRRCDAVIGERQGWSLWTALARGEPIDDGRRCLPALVAQEISLSEWWRARGVQIDAVIGHSVGEFAAAFAAGGLSLEDAVAGICRYADAFQAQEGRGGMAWVGVGWERATTLAAPYGLTPGIEDAAEATVVTGAADAIQAFVAAMTTLGLDARNVNMALAPHGPFAEPLADAIQRATGDLELRPFAVPFASGVTGTAVHLLSKDYFVQNATRPVRFASAVRALSSAGHRVFLDVGPHGITRRSVASTLRAAGRDGTAIGSLRRGDDARSRLADASAALLSAGVSVDRLALDPRARLPVRAPVPPVLRISAGSEPALRARAAQLADRLGAGDAVEVATTLAHRRSSLPHRLALPADAARLRAFAARGAETGEAMGEVRSWTTPRVVFVFPGQGGQWAGMGLAPAARDTAFASALSELDRHFDAELGWRPSDVFGAVPTAPIDRLQPALFAWCVATAAALQARGLRPDVVIGHSMGEVAAAAVSGRLSLRDAVRVIGRRSILLREIAGTGAMAQVELAAADLPARLAGYEDRVALAAHNGPRAAVIAGDHDAVDAIVARLQSEGVFAKKVRVDVASHSPAVDPLRPRLIAALQDLAPRDGHVSMMSSVHAAPVASPLDATYWADNLRQPVRFAECVSQLAAPGTLFVEVGPHPVLAPAITEALRGAAGGRVIAPIRRDEDELFAWELVTGAAWAGGVALPTTPTPPAAWIPPVPFDRTRFAPPRPARAGMEHPWVTGVVSPWDRPGVRITSARVGLSRTPWLGAHTIDDRPVLPGTAWLELLFSAAGDQDLAEITFERPLVLGDDDVEVQVVVEDDRVVAVSRDDNGWTRHVSARTSPPSADGRPGAPPAPLVTSELDADGLYAAMRAAGIRHDPPFRALRDLRTAPDVVMGRVEIASAVARGFLCAPVTTDAALHTVSSWWDGAARVPCSIERASRRGRIGARAQVYTARRADGACDVHLVAGEGSLTMSGVRTALWKARGRDALADAALEVAWVEAERPASVGGRWLASAQDGAALTAAWSEVGGTLTLVTALDEGALASFPDAIGVAIAAPASTSQRLDPVPAASWDALWPIVEVVRAARATLRRDPLRVAVWCPGAAEGEDVWAAARLGFLRALAVEQGDLRFRAVDAACATDFARAALAGGDEDAVSTRPNSWRAARLRPANLPPDSTDVRVLGTWLVSGGTGALGQAAARVLLAGGAERVVLVGRRSWHDLGDAARASVAALGGRAEVAEVDVTDLAAVSALISSLAASGPPLRGVLHAAGVLADATAPSLDRDRLVTPILPKVLGALNLHQATLGVPLDGFVLYGSLAAVVGTAGQAAYAAGNAAMEALVRSRRSSGLPATIIHWGSVAGEGLAARAGRGDRLAASGVDPFTIDETESVLRRALAGGASVVTPARFSARRYRETWPRTGVMPFYSELGGPKGQIEAEQARVPLGATAAAVRESVERLVRAAIDDVTRASGLVPLQAPFSELGVDSLVSLELRNRLELSLGTPLSATLLVTAGTPAALIAHLTERLAPAPAAAMVSAAPHEEDVNDADLDATLAELDAFLAGD